MRKFQRAVSATTLCVLVATWKVCAVGEYGAVDPFWGSGGTQSPKSEGMARGWSWLKAQTGNTHPGAVRPFGWVSVCAYSGAYSSGYGRFGVSSGGPAPERLKKMTGFGFTHFHHSGTGYIGKFYNLFLFTPHAPAADVSKASALTDETAVPGFYAATLADYGASFELTARPFAACHRYRFPDGKGIVEIDTTAAGYRRDIAGGPKNYRETATCERLEQANGGWRGSVMIDGTRLYFDLRILRGSVKDAQAKDGRIKIVFDGQIAETAIAFSYVGAEEAASRANEAALAGFDKSRNEAAADWSARLSRIRADFADKRLRSRFYSALYHSLVKPSDSGGKWSDFVTMWDVYRTQLPLAMSVEPDIARPMLLSLLSDSERLGYIPNFQLIYGDSARTDVQATSLALFTLADGFFRGALTKADYPRIKAAATREFANPDVEKRSPSHTIDIAGAYYAMAFVAKACGDGAYAEELRRLSGVWRKAYDPATGYLRERAKYYEGDNRTYSFRPHPGMADRIELAGGTAKFMRMLDDFFAVGYEPRPGEKDRIFRPGRFEGFNNESDIDAPFAYLWCGRADRMSEVIDLGRRCRFTDGEGGCPGNNDSGGISAWFVQACLGLHPVSGTPYYALGTPSVEKAEVDFARGTLRIRVVRESPRSIYPAGYAMDGRDLREPWVKVDELERGGELTFRLADNPSSAKSPAPKWYDESSAPSADSAHGIGTDMPYIYGAQYYRAPTPARENWDGDLANIKRKGFNTVKFWVQWRWSERREGEYFWDDLDELMRLADRHGLKVVLNLILDVMPEWVERDYPDSLMVDIDGKPVCATAPGWRQLGGYPGPCYSHAEVTKKRQRFTEAAYKHFRNAPALLAWDVWNEPERIAAHRTNDLVPALCFCASCRQSFRRWLAHRYGNIERLNEVWGRCYTSFDAVEAPVDVRCISDFIDWRAFQRDVLHGDAAWRLNMLRRIDPARHPHLHVVTATGSFSPSVAVDDFSLARACEIFGSTMVNDPYACAAGLSAAQDRYYYNAEWHINFGSIGSFQRVIGRDLFMYDQLSQIGWGIKGCLFWQFRSEVLGFEAPAWGLVRPDGTDRPVVRHAEEFIKAFRPYADDYLRCRRPTPRVLVWRSADNETFHYCRYNGVQRYHEGMSAWCAALYALNVPFLLCDTEMLEAGAGRSADVLVLPQAMYLRGRDAAAFMAFAKAGKTILAEMNVGAYNADKGRFSPVVPGCGLADEWDVRETEATSVFHLPAKTPVAASADGTDDISKAFKASGARGSNYFEFDTSDGKKGLGAWDFAQLGTKKGNVTARFGRVPVAVHTRTSSGGNVFYFGTQLGTAAAEKKDSSFLRHTLMEALKSAGVPADDAGGLHIDTLTDESGSVRFIVFVNRGNKELPVRLPPGSWKELFGSDVKTLRPNTAALFVRQSPGENERNDVLWPTGRTELRALADSRVTLLADGAMRVETGAKYRWPGVKMDFLGGDRDISAYGRISAMVSNTTDRAQTIHLHVKGSLQQGTMPRGSISLAPHASGELRVDLCNMPWALAAPVELNGMRGFPQVIGKGSSYDLRHVQSFHIFLNKPDAPGGFSVGSIVVSGANAGQKIIPSKMFLPFVDKYGQFIHDDWPGKIHGDSELKASREKEEAWLKSHGGSAIPDADKYGGWAGGPQLKATGSFRVEKVGGKWWFVDPDGSLFFSHGVDCVQLTDITKGADAATGVSFREPYFSWLPAKDDPVFGSCWRTVRCVTSRSFYGDPAHVPYDVFNFAQANAMRKYGMEWRTICAERAHARLKAWGLNTIANWSDPVIYEMRKTPYTATFNTSSRVIGGSNGWRGKFPDPFAPEFIVNVKKSAEEEAKRSGEDPWCIGWFVDNEIRCGDDDFALGRDVLRSPVGQPAKSAAREMLERKYGPVAALGAAWGTPYASWDAFLASTNVPDEKLCGPDLRDIHRFVLARYFREIRDAVKSAAPNRLYLGARIVWGKDVVYEESARYCDVVSVNIYKRRPECDLPSGITDRPLLVGEYHFGAFDRGMFHTGLVAVRDQNERAQSYRDYMNACIDDPRFVGAHWFQWRDQALTGRADGENFQIGFVTITDTPYPELVQAARDVGATMYRRRFSGGKESK